MQRVIFIIIFCALGCINSKAWARIHPADNAVLNFTQVLFEYDEAKGADYYIITIEGPGHKKTSIENHTLAFIRDDIFSFGQKYTWNYIAYKNKKALYKSPVYHFEIKAAFQTSANWLRSKVEISDTTLYRPGIIFLDYMGMAINRKGEPVWYMPLHKDSLENLKMRNIKMTAAGTITYLDNRDCFEKDIYANTVWKAPNDGQVSGDVQEYYHHEFFKMDDGTYITSGYRFVTEPNVYDNNVACKVRYNTIIQYDAKGDVLWWWDESKHADKKELYGDSGPTATEVTGTHLNGIAYYKPDDAFIASFRDNSAILKISHRTGEIVYNLGDSLRKYYPDEVPFASQHGPTLLKDGSIVVYNNNLDRTGKTKGPVYPLVKIFSQPTGAKQSQKVWDYECYSEKYPEGIFGKEGYAAQLPYSNNLLVCMGGANYVFEITPARQLVWQCNLQRYDENSKAWMAINNYRCSYATSLYPVYFTLQHFRMQSADKGIQFQINNEGSDAGSYIVEVNGRIYGEPVYIFPRESRIINTGAITGPRPAHSGTIITVYPAGNKQLQREIAFDD